jgi:hypothetical protein
MVSYRVFPEEMFIAPPDVIEELQRRMMDGGEITP